MKRDKLPRASGIAKHIAADGCQFVLERGALVRGQSVAFAIDGHGTVKGRVQWVVNDRIGFTFDNVLARDAQTALSSRSRLVPAIELSTLS